MTLCVPVPVVWAASAALLGATLAGLYLLALLRLLR